MRPSGLKPKKYLTRYFDNGTERTGWVAPRKP